ncbi:hypothetical protein H6B27_12675 [Pseudoflavonifractor phocaeensis]|nr:hypothetical protein [Pseudoflavonifractor phocaeensis]
MNIELEAGKTYILSIEYSNGPCDYTVSIGVPNPMKDATGSIQISGSLTYKGQKDRYQYTASTDGTYRFSSDLSAGGKVQVRISGENGNFLDDATNALSIELEAGKTYVLSVEYSNGPCDYTVSIGVPNPIKDVTGSSYISGNLTYKDQKDKYYYTAAASGTYQFRTELTVEGKVLVRISGENGNSINTGNNSLSIDLEANKTYILSIEYLSGPCGYGVSIEQQPIA